MTLRNSLEGRIALLVGAAIIACAGITTLFIRHFGSTIGSLAVGLAVALPAAIYAVHRFMQPVNRLLTALVDGVASFQDGDFSISLSTSRRDELGDLVHNYNQAGEILRRERYDLYQRELLLDTVIQSMPWALLLTNANDRVVYSNVAARRFFNDGRKPEGMAFSELLANCPETLREAIDTGKNGMFSLHQNGEDEIYYLSRERFTLNSQHHHLYLLKQLTRELNRQEVAVWKKVIRVISHELNNSLAPISSLAHSGRILAREPAGTKLESALASIEERATHLRTFIESYARFAKLPAPRIAPVAWQPFLATVRELAPFVLKSPAPEQPGYFDSAQLQQVLINLLKNAHESGSPPEEIVLAVYQDSREMRLEVCDSGPGMASEVLEQALLPFYSTKQSGTGLGLPLCREIVEAHGGRLNIMNRNPKGLTVSVWLPLQRAARV